MAEVIKETDKKPRVKVYSQDEVNELVKAAVAEAMKSYVAPTQPTFVKIEKDEYVTIMYIGQFASGCVVSMPSWGTITYGGGTIDIPKKDFLQGIGRPVNAELLKKRRVIVLKGLTDEEKKRFGVDYSSTEILDAQAFNQLLDLPKDEICEVFKQLCVEHKKIVAQAYLTAYFEHYNEDGQQEPDKRVSPDTVRALNKLSKVVVKEGMFTKILDDFGRRFADDE